MGVRISTVYGVDFSGARLAGENMWVARMEVGEGRLRVVGLDRLGVLAGTDERGAVMGKLVEMIAGSRESLWGMDFPFALPVELWKEGTGFEDQLREVGAFEGGGGGAKEFGRWCVGRCMAALGRMHVRRVTDVESRTPFDCYHYRIVYQTFHGMRDVLLPLRGVKGVAVVPFDGVAGADRVVVESCPSSTIKRWGLPHANYKQATGGPLTAKRRAVRKVLFEGVYGRVEVPEKIKRVIARNPGGDAMDAVIAGVGAWEAWGRFDERAVAGHGRYSREGMVFF